MKPSKYLGLLTLLVLMSGCRLVAVAVAIPIKLIVGSLALTAWILVGAEGSGAQAELYAGGIRVDKHDLSVELAADLTYSARLVTDKTITSRAGLEDAHKSSMTFDPRSQELELVRAEVILSDGSRIAVGEDKVFTRPSAAAQSTPGFVSKLTKTVVFPQLMVGSKTSVEWTFREKAQSVLGFNYVWRPSFAIPVKRAAIRIKHPADLALRFAADDAFVVQESTSDGVRSIEAVLQDYEGQKPERAMVDPRDVCPVVVFSTVASWEEIGAKFHAAVMGRVEDTEAIRKKAAEIVGDLEGLPAARAIHRWVCRNIQYIAVYLGQMDGWVPRAASEVLADGYGDCKGQFVLLASLLAARGIEAEPVLINLGRSWRPYPLCTPLQFDHCMAFLPKLDVYSDPTDPYRDLGELDVPLSGKFVVIGSASGRVATTPEGKADRNTYRVLHESVLAADGSMSGKSTIEVLGRPSGKLRRYLAHAADARQVADDFLMGAPEGVVGDLESTDAANLDEPLKFSGRWASELKHTMQPTVYLRTPVGIDLVTPSKVRDALFLGKRKYPVVLTALDIEWNHEIRLPAGYKITGHPKGVRVENDEASFVSEYEWKGDRLVVKRTLRLKRDVYAPEQYPALRKILAAAATDIQGTLIARRDG